jgi:hypothetical protein
MMEPAQTGPGTQPACYTTVTGLFPGLKRSGRGVNHPHPSSTYTSTPSLCFHGRQCSNVTFYQKRRHVIITIQDRHRLLNVKKFVSAKAMKAFVFHDATAPRGPDPAHYRDFTITLRHNTLCKTPLDKLSTQYRDLYLITQGKNKRQTSMPSAGFEPAIPASERRQTHALEHGH